MDAKEELLRIIDQFNLIYESEEAWHGPSVVEVLADVSWEMAAEKIMPNTHSIAELVYHMTTWRIFVVKRLQGDGEYEVTKARDWKTFPIFDEFEWEALQMELSLSQEELITELEKREDDEFLEEIVPSRQYDYYTMLHGILQHDLYHAGQISILKKALHYKGLGKKSRSDEDDYYGTGSSNDFDDMY
ncbi:MAG: DinB family protein [Spirosomataceae bacterium]